MMVSEALPTELQQILDRIRRKTDRLTLCADAFDASGIDQCIEERGQAMKELSTRYKAIRANLTKSQLRAFAEQYGLLEEQAEFAQQQLARICKVCKETTDSLRESARSVSHYGAGAGSTTTLDYAG